MTPEGASRAGAWVEHLRRGGTTRWVDWDPEDAPAASGRAEHHGSLPGAAQLELLRALNAEGALPGRVDQVLHRPRPGRGDVQLELPWPPRSRAAALPEVLRVAAGVLADLVAELPGADPTRAPRAHRLLLPRRPRGIPSFRLDGLPVTVAELRADLTAAGITEHRPARPWFGGSSADDPDVVLVVVGSLTESLLQVWSRRAQAGAARPWPKFVASRCRQDLLPPSADHLDTVAQWTARIGAGRVHVVTTEGLREQVGQVLGSAPPPDPDRSYLPGDPVRLPPALVDVLRRVNAVLPFVLAEPQRTEQRRRLVELMTAERLGPARLDVPAEHAGWVATAAGRLAGALAGSGCVLHGDLAVLAAAGGDASLREEDVLGAAVRMIHRVDAVTAPGEGETR